MWWRGIHYLFRVRSARAFPYNLIVRVATCNLPIGLCAAPIGSGGVMTTPWQPHAHYPVGARGARTCTTGGLEHGTSVEGQFLGSLHTRGPIQVSPVHVCNAAHKRRVRQALIYAYSDGRFGVRFIIQTLPIYTIIR